MTAWRVPFVVGSAARLAYGVASVLAPEWMGGRLAPTLRGHPDPRMNLRGFGGAQSAVAVYTLTTATTHAGARDALRLNMLVDGFDAAVSLLEWRDRGRLDLMAAGGIALNVAGLTCWALAHSALGRAAPSA
jgi:hypothetical protein